MKASVYCSVFAVASLWSLSTFGQGACHNDNGTPNNGAPQYLNDPANPYSAEGGDFFGAGGTPAGNTPAGRFDASSDPNLAPRTAARPSTGPTARITVVSTDETRNARSSTTPTATLTIVTDEAPGVPNSKEIATEEPTAIDAKIASLVGVWKAVARHGNGELTTVELHLDNRGWAELTVPGSDGKPNTTKSRVNLQNNELKLTGSEKVVSLGKLLESNSRQMVLERAEGRVTFVRI